MSAMFGGMFSYETHFAKEVQTFLDATGYTPTRFGNECLNDPHFIPMLRDGRSPTARTMDRVREWMVKQRPDVIRRSLCGK
jgi:hypothetical protein